MTRRRLAAATIASLVLLLISSAPAFGDQADPQVLEIDWSTQAPLSGSVVGDRVVLDEPSGGTFPIAVIDSPDLRGGDIQMIVEVIVGEMDDPGYLELWVVLADGSRFFSRTLDASGVGVLRSGFGEVVELPFILEGVAPASLELNAVLPGGGELEIGRVLLLSLDADSSISGVDDDAWWSQETSGLIGGFTGGLFGILGAVIGSLASRGKARRFVTGAVFTSIFVGVIAGVVGIVGLAVGQPYYVWFPFLLGGVLLTAIFGGLSRSIMAHYESVELQRIRAYDLA